MKSHYKCYAELKKDEERWFVQIGNGTLESCQKQVEMFKNKYKETNIKVSKTWIENMTTQNIIKSFCIQLINQYDLDINIIKDKNEKEVFKIKDLQNNNFGNIENEELHNLADVIARLDIYHEDYIFNPLEERMEKGENIKNNDWDLIAFRFLKSNKVYDILAQIYPFNFEELINVDVSKELKVILDKEEFPKLYYYVEKSEELFNIVSYDTLKDYEKSLDLYFETDDIVREEDIIYSKTNTEFNINIIKLSEDVIDFDTFLEEESNITEVAEI